jgi:hypothetical protein
VRSSTVPPAALALVARLLGHAPVAVADVALDLADDLAERRARDGLQAPGAAAALAGGDRRAGSAPLPWHFEHRSTAS